MASSPSAAGSDLERLTQGSTRRLRGAGGAAKARRSVWRAASMAFIAIVVFLIVIAALNRFEFGRFD